MNLANFKVLFRREIKSVTVTGVDNAGFGSDISKAWLEELSSLLGERTYLYDPYVPGSDSGHCFGSGFTMFVKPEDADKVIGKMKDLGLTEILDFRHEWDNLL